MNEATKEKARSGSRSLAVNRGVAEPFGRLRAEIDRLIDDFTTRPLFSFPSMKLDVVPAIEIREDKDAYAIAVELPGLKREDIDVTVADGILTVSGEKKEEQEQKEKGFLLRERSYGAFERQVALPSDAKADAITAKFEDGVLNIEIGRDKAVADRGRKIEIG